jgi:hypothetical protein
MGIAATPARIRIIAVTDGESSHGDQVDAAALDGHLAGFDACLSPWSRDIHADHEAVGRAVARVSHRVTGNSADRSSSR